MKMGKGAEKVKERERERESQSRSREASVQTTFNTENDTQTDVDSDTESEQRVSLEYDVKKDGTIGLSFEFKKKYDMASKIGNLGGMIITAGILIVIIAPILYVINIIPTLSLLLTIMSSPFAVGAGLITLSEKFEYLPGVRI
jgi:hypothetical protein